MKKVKNSKIEYRFYKSKGVIYFLNKISPASRYCFIKKTQEILKVKGIGESTGEVFHSKGWNHPHEVLGVLAQSKKKLKGVPVIPMCKREKSTVNSKYLFVEGKWKLQKTKNV